MDEEKETMLRLQALELAVPSSASGEQKEAVVARAEAYLKFLKGE